MECRGLKNKIHHTNKGSTLDLLKVLIKLLNDFSKLVMMEYEWVTPIPASNAPLGQRCIMVGIVTVGALLVHGWQNVGSWLAECWFMVGGLMLGQRVSNEQSNVGPTKYVAVGPTLNQRLGFGWQMVDVLAGVRRHSLTIHWPNQVMLSGAPSYLLLVPCLLFLSVWQLWDQHPCCYVRPVHAVAPPTL